MTNYARQPKNLKRVKIKGMHMHFTMNTTKKRILELINDPSKECYRPSNYISDITIESNSVWYDNNGNCLISNEE